MSKVLIIGAGGVGSVVVHKCLQVPEVFSKIHLASRTLSKCQKIKDQVNGKIEISKVDADHTHEIIDLINQFKPDLVINTALPYQDLTIMEACLKCKVDYLDTANYEPKDKAKFEYRWQWDYHDRFKEAGIMGLLGSGFDPGVTNVFSAYALKEYFDQIDTIDILDANGGDHGQAFATNFNPEINIREVTAKGRYFKNGNWVETDPLSIHQSFDFPEIGKKQMYLMYHEELESLAKYIPHLKQIRFWMTFSESYLTHLNVLKAVGMTRIDPVKFKGQEIIPLQFLKAVLPEPSSLGPHTKGKTCIGCIVQGKKDGKDRAIYIYNVCDHQACYQEVNSQAISYTTGVPAMIGAMMILTKTWKKPGIYNMEQLDPTPFMEKLNQHGLPWKVIELDPNKPILEK